MNGSAVYRPHREAPASAQLSPHAAHGAWEGLRAHRFEIVSRGDFVPGLLYLPENVEREPAPLVILQHPARGSKESAILDGAADWVREGFAVAAIDLALHGERSSPKLSERLCQGVDQIARGGTDLDLETRALVDEFARQSTSDLVRSLDALIALPEIDPKRIGFAGFGFGAVVGSYLLAHDSRPRAAVLAFAGGGKGPPELDPTTWLAQTPDTSILVVASEGDDEIPLSASRLLFEAAPKPRRFASFPEMPQSGLGKALGEIHSFLAQSLAL